jgi:hypothetical protein
MEITLKTISGNRNDPCTPYKESSLTLGYYGGDNVCILVGDTEHSLSQEEFQKMFEALMGLKSTQVKVNKLERIIRELRNQLKGNK